MTTMEQRGEVGVPTPGTVRYQARPVGSTSSLAGGLIGRVGPFVIALCLGVVVWQLVSLRMGDRSFLLPSPLSVLTDSLLKPDHLDRLLGALWLTTRVALLGLAISAAVGILVAIVMSQSRFLESMIYPYAVLLQTIPVLALVPLMGLWFGFGTTSRTVIVVIFALFPMISNTLFGLQSVEKGMHDFFTIRRATRWQRLRLLMLPAALPAIFVGLRTSSGLAVIGAVVGDMFFAQGAPGIGTLVTLYTSRLQSADLYAAIILASLLGIAVFGAFTTLARLAVGKWHPSHRPRE
ncbi:ABC transporter permease [Nocardioides sp.]|uniref:ABC transporter permease n=1 Tax=Nocardioides sp. TaxID=35761 RepID=UPI0039E68F46